MFIQEPQMLAIIGHLLILVEELKSLMKLILTGIRLKVTNG